MRLERAAFGGLRTAMAPLPAPDAAIAQVNLLPFCVGQIPDSIGKLPVVRQMGWPRGGATSSRHDGVEKGRGCPWRGHGVRGGGWATVRAGWSGSGGGPSGGGGGEGGEFGDAEARAAVGDELKVGQRPGGLCGAGGGGVGGVVDELPVGEEAAFDAKGHGGSFVGEGDGGNALCCGGEGGLGPIAIEKEGVVPGGFGMNGEVGGGECGVVGFELLETLADLEGEDQGAAKDGDGVVVACFDARLHGEEEVEGVAGLPFAFEGEEAVGGLPGNELRPHFEGDIAIGPFGDAEVEGELDGLVGLDGEADGAVEGVVGGFGDGDGDAVGDFGGDGGGAVDDGGEAVVGCGHPHMGDELGPALVHVGGAAAEVGFEAVEVGVVAIGDPLAFGAGGEDLVGLLVVLVCPEVGGGGGGEGIVGEGFDAVGEGAVAEDGGEL